MALAEVCIVCVTPQGTKEVVIKFKLCQSIKGNQITSMPLKLIIHCIHHTRYFLMDSSFRKSESADLWRTIKTSILIWTAPFNLLDFPTVKRWAVLPFGSNLSLLRCDSVLIVWFYNECSFELCFGWSCQSLLFAIKILPPTTMEAFCTFLIASSSSPHVSDRSVLCTAFRQELEHLGRALQLVGLLSHSVKASGGPAFV